jgi:hypothetical protein
MIKSKPNVKLNVPKGRRKKSKRTHSRKGGRNKIVVRGSEMRNLMNNAGTDRGRLTDKSRGPRPT